MLHVSEFIFMQKLGVLCSFPRLLLIIQVSYFGIFHAIFYLFNCGWIEIWKAKVFSYASKIPHKRERLKSKEALCLCSVGIELYELNTGVVG